MVVTFVCWYEDFKKRSKLFFPLPTTSVQINKVKGIILAGGRGEEDNKHEEEEKEGVAAY